jgi:type I restriction enzyme S subunit
MGNWPVVSLGDVIDFFDSRRIPLSSIERATRRGDFPYYGASGIIDWIDDYIFDGRYLLIAEDGENLNSRKLPVAFFAEGRFWVNNHAHIIRGRAGVLDDVFLQQWFAQADIGAYVTGAAQPKLSQANMKRIQIPLPPLTVQRKIAAILSAFDDLIENNKRRIRLLEEMAQRIYREWFVDFHYPGYETVPLVDSELGNVPQGWDVVRTSALIARGSLAIGDGYRAKNSELAPHGLPFVRIGDLREDFQFKGVDLLSPDSCTQAGSKISRPGDCIVSTKGTVGKVLFVPASAGPFVYSPQLSFWRVLGNELRNEYLVGWMRSPDFARQCANVKGATDMADYVNLKDQRHMLLPIPPSGTQRAFAEFIQPILDMIATGWSSSANLSSTRHLLLPRLISGDIDVTDLDIEVPEMAT